MTGITSAGMIDAAIKALSQMFAPALRRVLLKAVGLALVLIVTIGVVLQRFLAGWAETGANWAEHTAGVAPHAVWSALAWILSILASLGIITGALFLMPAVTAFVGSFFVDEVGEAVEREHYPHDPVGHALPFLLALVEGTKVAVLALLVYCVPCRSCSLPGSVSSFCFWRTHTCSVVNTSNWPRCAFVLRMKQRPCAKPTPPIFSRRVCSLRHSYPYPS